MVKPGIRTTELLITVLTDVGLLASALAGSLNPKWAAILTAVSTVAYSISRGMAKINAPAAPPAPVPPAPPAPVVPAASAVSAAPLA